MQYAAVSPVEEPENSCVSQSGIFVAEGETEAAKPWISPDQTAVGDPSPGR